MEPTGVDVDELIEFWTLLDEDRALLAGKRGATALGFALLLKHYSRHGRFPRGRSEVPDEVVSFVARQLAVAAGDLGFYEWAGSTIEYHRAQIRDYLGYRIATIADQEQLTGWLSAAVANVERRPDRVREELLGALRRLRIEPPTPGRILRMVRSALRTAEQNWAARIAGRLSSPITSRLLDLIAVTADDDSDASASLLALIKASPGNVSLESMMTEISKLQAVRALELPAGLFADVAPKVLEDWRARAAVEAPSHLRRHPQPLTVTLLAALVHQREREITDTLVELLIATVHRIGARAERRVTNELINAFKKVTGKENILFNIAEAALGAPDDAVREVVFPAVMGGEQTLRELVHEFKTTGPVYRRTVQTTLRSSYTGHYRRGLIALLDVLEFRSNNTAHRPVIDALTLITRYAKAGNSPTTRSVVGADSWRNPDEDLPADFEQRRAQNYGELRKPLDPAVFIHDLRSEMTAALDELNTAVPSLEWLDITDRTSGSITLSKYEAAPEPRNLRRIKTEGATPVTVPPAAVKPRRMAVIVIADSGSTTSRGSSSTRTRGPCKTAAARPIFLRIPVE